MEPRHLTYTYHTPGTLAANHTFVFKLPFDCTLIHVSAVGSNSNNGILDVGNTDGDTEAYVKDLDIGDLYIPATRNLPAHFVGGNYPHILAGTVIIATLDYDGAAGVATQNFTLSLIFTIG